MHLSSAVRSHQLDISLKKFCTIVRQFFVSSQKQSVSTLKCVSSTRAGQPRRALFCEARDFHCLAELVFTLILSVCHSNADTVFKALSRLRHTQELRSAAQKTCSCMAEVDLQQRLTSSSEQAPAEAAAMLQEIIFGAASSTADVIKVKEQVSALEAVPA